MTAPPAPAAATLLQGVAPLDHLGVLRVAGADATKFLQGQLTQDFLLVAPGEARLAAFCSAKGRVQASFVGIVRAPDDVLLVCARDLLEATRRRLSMFVLRAKAVLTDASGDFTLLGLAGDAATQAGALPDPWARVRTADGADLVTLPPADGVPRALWLAQAGTPPPAGPALSDALWRWGEVASGVATVAAAVADLFVPQMLNYESVGGVNFKKGCYPGQEVVARSQFRGTLKRRAYRVHADAPLAAGQEVFDARDAEQPCGTVVQAAPAPGGGWEAIASLQTAAADTAELRAGSADGAPLVLLPLPYALRDDI